MYLIIAKYADDAERKRIEYILEKWQEKTAISKPDGIVAIVGGKDADVQELVEELYSRVGKKTVALYRLDKVEVDVSEARREIEMTLTEDRPTVEKLLGFVMARQRAVLKGSSTQPFESRYEVISKKGKAEITAWLTERDAGVRLRLRITGYGEVVEYLYTKLSDELKYLKG